MQKQVAYPSFIKRLFSTMMDLLIFSLFLSPIVTFINRKIFLHKFGDILIEKAIDLTDDKAIVAAMQSKEFIPYLTSSVSWEITIIMFSIHFIFLSTFFIVSWHFFGATPVKYLMNMRIVDKETMQKPKLRQLILRFLGYSLFIIGIWWIVFTKQKQALHDKLSSTVVIKI